MRFQAVVNTVKQILNQDKETVLIQFGSDFQLHI